MNQQQLTSCLVCRVHDRLCALPVAHVIETMRPLNVRRLAEAGGFILGVSIIRGKPVPVIDAASLLGAPSRQPTRFVTVRAGTRQIALAVDLVVGIVQVPSDSIDGLPPLLRDARSDIISALGTLDRELLYLLNSARIVPESLWFGLEGENNRGRTIEH